MVRSRGVGLGGESGTDYPGPKVEGRGPSKSLNLKVVFIWK